MGSARCAIATASLALPGVAVIFVTGCSGDTTTTVIKNTMVSQVTTTTTASDSMSQPSTTYDH